MRKKLIIGVTLPEAAMGALLTGIAAVFLVIGIKYVNGLTKTSSQLEVGQEAQIVLYQITSDIRDSDNVLVLEPDNHVLSLQTYDYSQTYSVLEDPTLFDPDNISTITYHYSAAEDCLIRTEERGGQAYEKRFLRSMISLGVGDTIFSTGLNGAIDIELKLAKGLMGGEAKSFEASAMVRGEGRDFSP